jgi:iron complex transport system ATP-binding protein
MKGESWVLIGPNGAGKTSLVSIINGYRWPGEGEVSVLGVRFGETDLRDLRSRVGFISAYLEGWIAPEEKVVNLIVAGSYGSTRAWRRLTRAERNRALSLLRTMGCGELIGKTVNRLSQGERQKVLIARALMSDPKLLVLDEPCEGLDLASRESFLEGLSRLAKLGETAIVYVTHRVDEIPHGFTHALLLKSGRVLASGKIGSTLTSENLSRCFGLSVRLQRVEGRYYSIVGKGR